MCKHVAATLYGAGARLDAAPELLFILRGVDRAELITTAGAEPPMTRKGVANERFLADDDVGALFGIDMTATAASSIVQEKKRNSPPKDDVSARAGKPASRRGGTKAASPSSLEAEKPVGSGKSKKAPRAGATVATHRKKARPGKTAAAVARKAAGKAPAPATDKAIEKMAAPPETPSVKMPAKSRRAREAPADRTRAAKWIGAKARRARG
jgi:hypothetical protein